MKLFRVMTATFLHMFHYAAMFALRYGLLQGIEHALSFNFKLCRGFIPEMNAVCGSIVKAESLMP